METVCKSLFLYSFQLLAVEFRETVRLGPVPLLIKLKRRRTILFKGFLVLSQRREINRNTMIFTLLHQALPLVHRNFLKALFLTLLTLSTSLAYAEQDHEYAFAVTDIVGLEELQREFEAFQSLLSKLSGYNIKLFPVTSRTIVVEAFRSKKLDFALTGPAEYVVLSTKTEAKPIVGLTRPGYYSVLVTKSESGIKDVQGLKSKKVAFGDFGSTSYHLAPLQILADHGLKAGEDVQTVNLSKLVAWKSFVRDKVDAIGINQSRFELFKSRENLPDEAYKIIAKGPELPNDLIVAASHVPEEVSAKIQKIFTENGQELLEAMLQGKRNKKYEGMAFFTDINDSDYNYVRKMYRTAGYEEFAQVHKNS